MHDALSPLDGRYQKEVKTLRLYFSEEALVRARLEIEVRYFIALCKLLHKKTNPKKLLRIVESFNASTFKRIKAIETRTNHDVKAIEYYLRTQIKTHRELIHFGLTSEDINNLAYGILIHRALHDILAPTFCTFMQTLNDLQVSTKATPLLCLTHGQPATPTTLGKAVMVFVSRLYRQLTALSQFRMQGKLGGAVGNFAAHKAAYPDINWEKFRDTFVKQLGLIPLKFTTQINPHDDLAELSHLMFRINTILINFARDMWMYISRGVFRQKIIKEEIGSSAMPHKVNPIDFENAEGNLGLSNALFSHFAEKLPISRLQRDLSDSTVQRNIGVAFGHHLLALQSLQKGMVKITADAHVTQQELSDHPEVFAELIQTVCRAHGIPKAYEKLKTLTRGKRVTASDLAVFIQSTKMPIKAKKRLLSLFPLPAGEG